MDQPPRNILFFDGLCGLCDGLVQFILKIDRDGSIALAAIQSEAGAQILETYGVSNEERKALSTLFFIHDGILYRRSQAVFQLFRFLPFPWRVFAWLRILPRRWTDIIYHWVSTHRLKVMGRLDQCRIPNEKERRRFIS